MKQLRSEIAALVALDHNSSSCVQGDEADSERDVRVRFTGPALERKADSNANATKSSASPTVSSSPAQGILTPILITGVPG